MNTQNGFSERIFERFPRSLNLLNYSTLSTDSSLFMPFSKKGGHIALLLLSVCWSVCLSVHQHSFRSFSPHWLHILKWNLVYRFIIRISSSSIVLGTIEQFLTELCPLTLKNSNYLHFPIVFFAELHILIQKWNLVYRFIIRKSRSSSVSGTINQFLTALNAPKWTKENSNSVYLL
jgi:hypothetical protein